MFRLERPIETERLTLRAFHAGDLDDVYAMRSLPEVVRFLYGDELTLADAGELLERCMRNTRIEGDDDALAIAVERREDGRVIGDLTLWLRSAQHRQGEIGCVFHPDAQGCGYASESVSALLALAFGTLGLHRVYGRTDGRNDASAALMRRLGMRQEAHLRQNEIFKGEWGDELVFAILEDEWRERS